MPRLARQAISYYHERAAPEVQRLPRIRSDDAHALLGLSAALAQLETEQDVARLMGGAVASGLHIPFGAVLLQGQIGQEAGLFGHFTDTVLDGTLAREIEAFFSSSSIWGDAPSTEWVYEIDLAENVLPTAALAGLRRLLIVRLGTIHAEFGVLIAGRKSGEPCSKGERMVLEALAGQASIALQRVELTQRLLRQARELTLLNAKLMDRLRVLNELMRIAVSSVETDEALDLVGGQIKLLVDFDLMVVSLRPPGADYLEVFAVVGEGQEEILGKGARLPLPGSPMGEVLLTGHPVVRTNLNEEGAHPIELLMAREGGYRSVVFVRLESKGRSVGTLGLFSRQPGRYGEQDLRVVQEVADQLAVLVEDSLLHEEIKQLAAIHERTRLARETQDAVTRVLTEVIVQLDLAEGMMNADVRSAREDVGRARQAAHVGLERVHQAFLALRSSAPDRSPAGEAVAREIESLTSDGITVNISVAGTLIPVGPEVETSLFNVTQAVVSNIRRRGNAARVNANLEYGAGWLTLTIDDDGVAQESTLTAPAVEIGGLGFAREAERLRALGGELRVGELLGRGTRTTVRVPYIGATVSPVQPGLGPAPQPEARPSIRVLIADDHVVFRHGIRRLLEEAPDIEVVAEAADGREALAKARISQPDVMVTDVRIPGLGAIELAYAIKAEGLVTRLIILSPYSQGEIVAAAMRAGAHGYLLKDLSGPELVNAIRAVHTGETVLKPGAASDLVRSIDEQETAKKLTPREKEVLHLLARGLRNKEIAREIGLSEATVKFHVAHLFEKLEVNGRTEALSKALQLGIVTPP